MTQSDRRDSSSWKPWAMLVVAAFVLIGLILALWPFVSHRFLAIASPIAGFLVGSAIMVVSMRRWWS